MFVRILSALTGYRFPSAAYAWAHLALGRAIAAGVATAPTGAATEAGFTVLPGAFS